MPGRRCMLDIAETLIYACSINLLFFPPFIMACDRDFQARYKQKFELTEFDITRFDCTAYVSGDIPCNILYDMKYTIKSWQVAILVCSMVSQQKLKLANKIMHKLCGKSTVLATEVQTL